MARISAAGPTRQDILNAIDAASLGDTIVIPQLGKNDFVEKLISLTFEDLKLKTHGD